MTPPTPGARQGLPVRLERRNALFQRWQSLLTNRTKRTRNGEMIIQGVRPISQAIAHGVTIRALLSDGRERPSHWAQALLQDPPGPVVELTPELMAELGERADGAPELLAVAALPSGDMTRLVPSPAGLVVVFDRPSGPGNIGSLVRTADALGADGVVVTGHSADVWDPAAIRASTGSVFAVPVLRRPSHHEVLAWIQEQRHAGTPWSVVGLDEAGGLEISGVDLTGPVLLVVGNETVGMSAGWREACDVVAEIPMGGSASSLNASVAGSIALYEARRQRGGAAGAA